jgi:hypothetical protein
MIIKIRIKFKIDNKSIDKNNLNNISFYNYLAVNSLAVNSSHGHVSCILVRYLSTDLDNPKDKKLSSNDVVIDIKDSNESMPTESIKEQSYFSEPDDVSSGQLESDPDSVEALPNSELISYKEEDSSSGYKDKPVVDSTHSSDKDFYDDKSVIDGELVNDPIISDSAIKSLIIFNESRDIVRLADSIFKDQSTRQNKYIVPNDDLNFLKDVENAKSLKLMSEHLVVNLNNWEWLVEHYRSVVLKVVYNLSPIGEEYLSDIDRLARSNNDLKLFPLWCLNNVSVNPFANIMYSISIGAADLLIFKESKYDILEFEYNYNGAHIVSTNDSPINRIKIKGSKSGTDSSALIVDDDLGEKPFDVNTNSVDLSNEEVTSIFTKSSAMVILSNMFKVVNKSSDFGFSSRSVTQRQGNILRGGTPESLRDGFSIDVAVDNNTTVRIYDVAIFKLLLSMFYIDDLDLPREEFMRVLNYIFTIVQSYVISNQIYDSNVKIYKMHLKFTISRNAGCSTQSQLNNLFYNSVNDGHITLISPLHFQYYNNIRNNFSNDSFYKYMILGAISCPQINHILKPYLPSLDMTSRVRIKNVIRNKNWLDSSYYIPEVALPWQKLFGYSLDTSQFIDELAIRTFITDGFPKHYPVFSEGGWKSVHTASFIISTASLHPIGRFRSSNDIYKSINDVVDGLLLSDFPQPRFIRRQVRMCDVMPNIFRLLVP